MEGFNGNIGFRYRLSPKFSFLVYIVEGWKKFFEALIETF